MKTGTKCKVVADKSGHRFDIGQEVYFSGLDDEGESYFCAHAEDIGKHPCSIISELRADRDDIWWLTFDEVEVVGHDKLS